MTYEEAINQLNSVVIYHEAKCTREALDIAIKCIEKQMPKKPIGAYKTCDTGEITYWKCPNCNYEHEVEWGSCDTDHCHNCGQAIDWSD